MLSVLLFWLQLQEESAIYEHNPGHTWTHEHILTEQCVVHVQHQQPLSFSGSVHLLHLVVLHSAGYLSQVLLSKHAAKHLFLRHTRTFSSLTNFAQKKKKKIIITFATSNLFSTSMTSSSMSKSLTTSSFSGGGAKTSSFTRQNKHAQFTERPTKFRPTNMKTWSHRRAVLLLLFCLIKLQIST